MRILITLGILFAVTQPVLAQSKRTEREFEKDKTPRPGHEQAVPTVRVIEDYAPIKIGDNVVGTARLGEEYPQTKRDGAWTWIGRGWIKQAHVKRTGEWQPYPDPAPATEQLDLRIEPVEIDAAGNEKRSLFEVGMSWDSATTASLTCGSNGRLAVKAHQIGPDQFEIHCRYWKKNSDGTDELRSDRTATVFKGHPVSFRLEGDTTEGPRSVCVINVVKQDVGKLARGASRSSLTTLLGRRYVERPGPSRN